MLFAFFVFILPWIVLVTTLAYSFFKYGWRCSLIVFSGVIPIVFIIGILYIKNVYIFSLSPEEKQATLNLIYSKCETREVECGLNKKIDGWEMIVNSNYPNDIHVDKYRRKMSSLNNLFNIKVNTLVFNDKTIFRKEKVQWSFF